VNTVGAIFTHEKGIVLRPTYHVFDLYTNHTYEDIVHAVLSSPTFEVTSNDGKIKKVQQLDAIVTRDATGNQLSIVLVNLHGEDTISCRIRGLYGQGTETIQVKTLTGDSVNAFNDIAHPNAVSIQTSTLSDVDWDNFEFECPAHSVSVLNTTI
jgi:alpha-N-arabinofuranosidase